MPFYGGVTSVAVKGGVIAVAIDTTDIDDAGTPSPRPGVVALFDADNLGAAPTLLETGNHPDMVTFSADGTKIFVANEAEKSEAYAAQPKGGITIVDLVGSTPAATTYDFSSFDGQEEALREAGVRIFPGASVSDDVEPEYITASPDGTQLFVTLQEANAVAVFDLATRGFTAIRSQGVSEHSLPGFEIDASDRDEAIAIENWPVFGLRMADAIAAFEVQGQSYYATVNEGDDRGETARVADLTLDPDAFPDSEALQAEGALGRLTVSTIDGDTDGDGDYDALYSYGGRSFSIYAADGSLVFDSGSTIEQAIADLRPPLAFNNEDYRPGDAPEDGIEDTRSDNKGPEPEALAVGEVDGALYAFVGLESDNGIMIFSIDDPRRPELAAYIESPLVGDAGPETIRFIEADDSATGNAQIAVAYEVSGTTTLIDLASRVAAQVEGRDGGLAGSIGTDVLVGRRGANELTSGGGNDKLIGLGGDDVLDGGFGDDCLIGGRGADRLVFRRGEGSDLVLGFQEQDVLDFSSTGASFADLDTETSGRYATTVTLDEGLSVTLIHGRNVMIDESDFMF